jgi:hypothetical protein
MPFFSFMTGASTYRCEAKSREEVLEIVRQALSPTPDMMAIIESTLYEEGLAATYVEQVPIDPNVTRDVTLDFELTRETGTQTQAELDALTSEITFAGA